MKKYAFWNNKGGTGKTSLAFQGICQYAQDNPTEQIIAIDVCPQGNLSELFLGGMEGGGAEKLYGLQSSTPRRTIGGYFETRLASPYNRIEGFDPTPFISKPYKQNGNIPDNISLLAGDPVLELQSNAMSSLANQQIPGIQTWLRIVDWLNDFIHHTGNTYQTIFFDLNPSFSMYTQIALAASSRVILPVMADDSSKRAILNAFSLIYSLSLPSEIYKTHAFGERLKNNDRELPKVHLIIKNRITQYMGSASAYESVLKSITDEVDRLRKEHPQYFSKSYPEELSVNIGDFNTTGVVAFARGLPFFKMEEKGKSYDIRGKRVQVRLDQRNDRVKSIKSFSELL
jgi:cellulose biosynthesis protein BcsQ